MNPPAKEDALIISDLVSYIRDRCEINIFYDVPKKGDDLNQMQILLLLHLKSRLNLCGQCAKLIDLWTGDNLHRK